MFDPGVSHFAKKASSMKKKQERSPTVEMVADRDAWDIIERGVHPRLLRYKRSANQPTGCDKIAD